MFLTCDVFRKNFTTPNVDALRPFKANCNSTFQVFSPFVFSPKLLTLFDFGGYRTEGRMGRITHEIASSIMFLNDILYLYRKSLVKCSYFNSPL